MAQQTLDTIKDEEEARMKKKEKGLIKRISTKIKPGELNLMNTSSNFTHQKIGIINHDQNGQTTLPNSNTI